MYKFSYAEILEDSSTESRARERDAFDRALELLVSAESAGLDTPECRAAMLFLQRLWGLLIRDLTDANNELAPELRADLVSIGLWNIREADRVLEQSSSNFSGLININRTIRDGLQ
ncbi:MULTISPECIES: flagellar biosynthesis regulator FlaF [Azorhizobium]|uniref:Flagellar FlaF protein n=1 Tax=Azorhizobium caulinodans (strain ATCC 43989 / DSM 5975 / JCM 20966 / LMG 6465 / NBRC 14845 / NCIMB 13405 / ORS 571) TaxID=438753 RepID=A8IPM0_AZOC5|nr:MULTISPECIES: flagellar biosynthesis regulator FlaF [Azorhizobium]TDT88878.1 flagellar protein FlaF [Azorhizobium sp. AG788]BAF86648.1 flagellar FlaF protein [Azorhizobium caulinodans ORS 571]